MKKRLLVITDCRDVAANELRAVLVTQLDKLGADNVVVEPIVATEEFSVLHGSFLARLLAESYDPASLTILAVVNPLSTSSARRARIAGRLKNGIQFVGANTGIFSLLIKEFGLERICETDQTGLKGDAFISFGGKYIHAPIAAQLAHTGDLDSVAVGDFSTDDMMTLDYAAGTVLHVDNFGVPKLFYLDDELHANEYDRFTVKRNGEELGQAIYCHSMKALEDGQLAIYKGSSLGFLEIGIVRQLGTAGKLGIAVGDTLDITPC